MEALKKFKQIFSWLNILKIELKSLFIKNFKIKSQLNTIVKLKTKEEKLINS